MADYPVERRNIKTDKISPTSSGVGKIELTPNADQGTEINTTGTKPVASETYRGQIWVERGGAGARDRLYVCLKSDSDTFSWLEVANGGA